MVAPRLEPVAPLIAKFVDCRHRAAHQAAPAGTRNGAVSRGVIPPSRQESCQRDESGSTIQLDGQAFKLMDVQINVGVVDVWWALRSDRYNRLRPVLSARELARLSMYRTRADRQRFLIGAAVVRLGTARYLGVAADRVQVDRICRMCSRPHGRVRLPAAYGLDVSVAHAGDWIGVAFRRGGPVGLDVEQVSTAWDPAILGSAVLSPTEANALDQLPIADRAAGFLRLWTRKEAVLKATGEGLGTAPSNVVVSAPTLPARLVSHARHPELASHLSLHDLEVDADHLAALAVLGSAPDEIRRMDADGLIT